jgi:thiamine kinase
MRSREPVVEAVLADTPVSLTCRVLAEGRPAVLRVDRPVAARLGLDRAAEPGVLAVAGAAGLGPTCLAANPAQGTLLTEWLPGAAWTAAELRQPPNLERAARLLRRVHALPAVGSVLDLPGAIRRYAGLAGPASRELARDAEAALAACPGPTAGDPPRLCHNDPTPGNFIAGPGGELRLIDWEYAALGDPAFDLAGLALGAGLEPPAEDLLLAAYGGGGPVSAARRARHGAWKRFAALLGELWHRAVRSANQ